MTSNHDTSADTSVDLVVDSKTRNKTKVMNGNDEIKSDLWGV